MQAAGHARAGTRCCESSGLETGSYLELSYCAVLGTISCPHEHLRSRTPWRCLSRSSQLALPRGHTLSQPFWLGFRTTETYPSPAFLFVLSNNSPHGAISGRKNASPIWASLHQSPLAPLLGRWEPQQPKTWEHPWVLCIFEATESGFFLSAIS